MMNSCGKRPVDAQNVSWSLKKQRKEKRINQTRNCSVYNVAKLVLNHLNFVDWIF